MTSNQIALKESKTKERAERETARSNKARESIERGKLQEARKKRIQEGILGTANIISKVGPNDPSWYNQDAQLVKDAAAISFNNPLGGTFDNPITSLKGLQSILPGIATITWMPTIGKMSVDGAASTADIAAKSVYSYVRYANSGARNYEASDLMMYLLAVDQAYSYYGFLSRLYSLALDYNPKNRYYVNAMIRAQGVDPDDLRHNLADFRSYINTFAVRLNSMYVPKDLPLFQRHMWMNTGIFKDQDIDKAQTYMYVQKAFLAYDDQEGKLTVFPTGSPSLGRDYMFGQNKYNSLSQLKYRGDLLINSLVNSEDAGIMAGDILKAYGDSNMAYAASIPENFHIEPIFSLEVLSQIHNTILTGVGEGSTPYSFNDSNTNLFDIGQTTVNLVSYLTQGMAFRDNSDSSNIITGYGLPTTFGLTYANYREFGDGMIGTENYPVNFYKDDVSPDDIMVATRLQCVIDTTKWVEDDGNMINAALVVDSGTEVALSMNIISLNKDDLNTITIESIYSNYHFLPIQNDASNLPMFLPNPTNKALSLTSLISCFDWHPIMYFVTQTEYNANGASYLRGVGNAVFANYTSLKNTTRSNLNYVAILSELGIPKLGLTVRTR